jgi:hypothetical protein
VTIKKLNLTQQIETTLAYAFYSFNSKSGWMEWFTYKAYGYAKKNAVMRPYQEAEGNFAFYFTEEEANQRIAFDFIDLEAKHTSQVEVSFEEEGGMVTVSLEHSGIPEEQFENIKKLWEKGLANLKTVIEKGKDPRMWDRPYLGITVKKWLSQEVAPEQSLPVDYGMRLDNVFSGGGADKAGLKEDDIVISMAGRKMLDHKVLMTLKEELKVGDVVSLSYYRGTERHDVEIRLSGYPLPEPPPTAHDLAEQIERFQRGALKRITQVVENYNEAQIAFRPGPNEWSAQETLAHLIAYESDLQIWVSTMVSGCEEFPCSASHAPRLKSLLSLYPAVEDLLAELGRRQKETSALLLEIPAEYVNRKGSFYRLASDLNYVVRKHYKGHIAQIKESLEKAENVRAN